MNAKDKKQVAEWIDKLDEISIAIAEMEQNEEDKFDKLPEGIQDSERGDAIQEAIERLQEASGSIGDAIDSLNEIIE